MVPNPPNRRPIAPEDLAGDLISPGSPLYGVVWINPGRMSGAPCFFGTRVPLKNLFDYLRAGHPVADFMLDFPGVSREQIEAVLNQAETSFLPQGRAA